MSIHSNPFISAPTSALTIFSTSLSESYASEEDEEDPLFEAVLSGDEALVENLLLAGANPDKEVSPGDGSLTTSIHEAVGINKEKILELLLKAKANPNQEKVKPNGAVSSPLYTYLVHCKNERLMKIRLVSEKSLQLLLQYNADPNQEITNEDGSITTPFDKAVQDGNTKIIASLLEKGGNPNYEITNTDGSTTTPFFNAIKAGDERVIELLLKSGANPNQEIINADRSTTTALYASVLNGNEKVVELLLKGGANPNQEVIIAPTYTRNPLYQAVKSGNEKMVALLLKKGANPNRPLRSSGLTSYALGKAVEIQNEKIIELLLKAKANPNAADNYLYKAVRLKNMKIIELFLKAGADPNKEIVLQDGSKTSAFREAILPDYGPKIMSLFFSFSQPQFKLDITGATDSLKVWQKTYKLTNKQKEAFTRSLAKKLPLFSPKGEKIRCASSIISTELRDVFLKAFYDPFIASNGAAPLNQLLIRLLKKINQNNPEFCIFWLENEGRLLGDSSRLDQTIRLFVPTAGLDANARKKMILSTPWNSTLLHELTHLSIGELDLRSQTSFFSRLKSALAKDWVILHRKKKDDPFAQILLERFSYVLDTYRTDKQVEENFVRLTDIINELAKEGYTWGNIEGILNEYVPNLYKIHKYEFIPMLKCHLMKS